ncbi:phage tail protein [Streptomyces sp. R302]|uniref:phage tail protein n=1 Tax=unclassified Streptomyces TaxID=2593676 RepID=UPI00145C482C|nr:MULTISPECIES: phage tail protein [unclassified Streptomyces]NML50343.1 phage tail protein [Streptomyces sp. R301]NML79334.1 phage tail protein [Streptomyces sp. R302]
MSLRSSLGRASGSLRQFKSATDTANRATAGLGRQAVTADRGVSKVRTSSQRAATELQKMQRAADKAERSMAKAGRTGQKSGTQVGKFKSGADKASKGMKGLNKSMKGNIIGTLLALFAPLIEKVVEMATRSKTMQKILKVAFGAIKKVISSVMKVVGPIMKKAGALIKKVWNGIKKAITVVIKAVAKVIKTYFNAWKKIITTVMNAVKKVISSVWNGIKKVITPVVNWIKNVVPKAFTAVKDKLSRIWGGLKDIAGRAFDKIKGAVKGPINAVIDLINSAIRKLNGIKVSIPGWVPLVGGKTFGVSLPTIPRLAQGGVVQPRRGGVHTIVAEAGEAEAVLPLSKLDRLMRHTARRARAEALNAGTGATAGFQIENYYEASSSDLRETAHALLFLSKARG